MDTGTPDTNPRQERAREQANARRDAAARRLAARVRGGGRNHPGSVDDVPTVRIELRRGHQIVVLTRVRGLGLDHATLSQLIVRLKRERVDGWLVVIDEGSETVIARHQLQPRRGASEA